MFAEDYVTKFEDEQVCYTNVRALGFNLEKKKTCRAPKYATGPKKWGDNTQSTLCL